jgi:hypothetical protein
MTMRPVPTALVAAACILATACSSSGASVAATDGSSSASSVAASSATTWASASTSPAPGEAVVRSVIASYGTADHFGWVQASAKEILATYYPPGSKNYIGGRHVEPTDQIIVIKMHGTFGHSALPGAKTTATMALTFYNATTKQDIGFTQMWDGDAPDLGVGWDPGVENREVAAARWDLRLVGRPTVRSA